MATKAHRALERAIERAGGQSALATALGVRQSHIWHWLHRSPHGVPAERAGEIERVTGVPSYELRPDLFTSAITTAQIHAPPISATDIAANSLGKRGPPSGHFSRFKHLRRNHFASSDEIDAHVRALREEWERR